MAPVLLPMSEIAERLSAMGGRVSTEQVRRMLQSADACYKVGWNWYADMPLLLEKTPQVARLLMMGPSAMQGLEAAE